MSAALDTFLGVLKGATAASDPNETVSGLVDPTQPAELQSLLETLACHPHGGIETLGRYSIRTNTVAPMSASPVSRGAQAEYLPGLSSDRTSQFGCSDDGESFLFAAWNPGDTWATIVEWTSGGYANDGPRVVGRNLIAGLSKCVMDYANMGTGATRLELCDDNADLKRLMF